MNRATSAGFVEKLHAAWRSRNSLVCVGLDPELERLPAALPRECESIYRFNCTVIDATADLVCAYKPQIAHYAAVGAERELERTIAYVHATHPDIPVLLDAKRGDVGHTAQRYAMEAFERYGADAVTVNPYLGSDSLAPFLKYRDRGVFVVCRT
jgi:orotidine-5'-phosphate decarboxylase